MESNLEQKLQKWRVAQIFGGFASVKAGVERAQCTVFEKNEEKKGGKDD